MTSGKHKEQMIAQILGYYRNQGVTLGEMIAQYNRLIKLPHAMLIEEHAERKLTNLFFPTKMFSWCAFLIEVKHWKLTKGK